MNEKKKKKNEKTKKDIYKQIDFVLRIEKLITYLT